MGSMEMPAGSLRFRRPGGKVDSTDLRATGAGPRLAGKALSRPRGRGRLRGSVSGIGSCIFLPIEAARILAALIAAVLALSSGALWALDPQKQIGQYGHDSWTSQRGLPGEAVYQVLQSKDGYLWVRTGSGLARFDGVRFVPVDAELGSEAVKAMCMSADGDLLIRTATRTVLYKDRQFTDYLPPAPLPGGGIRVLFESREHVVFIGSDDSLYRMERSGKATILRGKTGWIFSLVEDRNGTIWIATANALFSYVNGQLSEPFDTGTRSSTVTSLMEDRQGRLWAGAAKGLFRLDGNRSAVRLEMQSAVPALATAVLEDSQGNIWVGTQTSGLARQTNNSISTFDTIAGLSDDLVLCLFEDREGSLWIGTASGLDRLRDTSLIAYTTREGLPTNAAKSAVAMRDGSLTVFTDSGGLVRIAGSTVTGFSQNAQLPSLSGQAIFESTDGSLWIGTLKGLSRIKDGNLTVYPGDGHFSRYFISAISEDGEGLIVSNSESRVFRLKDGETLPFTVRGKTTPVTDAGIYTFTICRGTDGTLWFGTSNGLYKISADGSDGKNPQPDVKVKFDVTSIFDDSHGSLWLGGRTPGLVQYRIADGRVTRYTRADGLFDRFVSRVLGDDNGNLWISTEDGIYSVSQKELADFADGKTKFVRPRRYSLADGMKTTESSDVTSQPAGARTSDGRLWFTTKKGIVMADPRHLLYNTLAPPVLVESVLADSVAKPLTGEVLLSPGTKNIEIQYTALSLRIPERVRFKYRLEGYDDDWVDAGPQRVAYYGNLRPGRYRFHVVAANDDGLWNQQGAFTDILLEAHFYQTPLFFAVCVLLAILAIVAGNRVNTRLIRRRGAQLAALVEEKTAELKHLAHCDALTSLPNRRLFNQFFAKTLVLAERRRETAALLLVDFDKFKQINDTFGHDAGDAFLIEASVRLQAAIRGSDSVSRLGGDEFAILLSNDPDQAGIAAVCDRIVESFREPVLFKTAVIHSSASIGVAVFPQHGRNEEALYKSADLALYRAKRAGRNNWHQFRPADGQPDGPEDLQKQTEKTSAPAG
jgi:diguanylate cyclase (GGDEF)-like protein